MADARSRTPGGRLEGAARRGRRVYWISSHGRNKNGEWRASRHQFVATEIEAGDGGAPQLRPAGKPYRDLAAALAGDPGLHEVRLAEAIRADDRKAKRLAPKAEGLNIEALAAAPDSEVLYLALRNPRAGVAEGKGRRAGARGSAAPAIVIPLMNADAVLERAARPEFGAPLLWDLGGYGIRSMDYAAALGGFLIAAGPRDDERGGMLYRWSGQRAEAPAPLRWRPDAPRFQPEAIVAWPGAPAPDGGAARVLVLSDDGAELVAVSGPEECAKGEYRADGTCPNKALRDPARRTFRAAWLSLRTENE